MNKGGIALLDSIKRMGNNLEMLQKMMRWLGEVEPLPAAFSSRRWFRLFFDPRNVDELAAQVADLRSTTLSLIQDVAVLRGMLRARGMWDEGEYRRQRLEIMVRDHSSAGATPQTSHSYYPYTLDEREFLESVLKATPQEVAEFEKRVEHVQTLT